MAWLTVSTLLLSTPLFLAGVFVAQTLHGLLRNYASARTIGVPIRFIPISPLNPFWVLLDRTVLSFLRRLPFGDNSFTRYNWRGWEVADRYRSHQEMGDIWVLVTPLKNWIYVNDPEALNSVFRRGTDFPRPVFVNEILEVFGPNISTATGQAWKTQRKVALHCFNEQNNEIVWGEAITLARDMRNYWTSKSSVNTAAADLRTLSLHVLSRAGFGKSFKFESREDHVQKASSGKLSYKDSLQTILENLVLVLGLGTKFIAHPWLPKKLRDVHAAYVAFRTYMTETYEEEKAAYAEGRTTGSTLIQAMIRASQAEANTKDGGGMAEAEIYGNMFVFNFAGHDTTAHSFTFAMFFLAANPHVQDWLGEEIHRVLGDRPIEQWDYRADFPRLKRCLAVLYETLRLYVPVPTIKWTADKAQPLVVNGKNIVLPPDCMVVPSYGAVQTDPRFWGSDSLQWNPSRFIVNKPNSSDEDFRIPVRGSFVGWSDGARDCPGRKFSQVEFVATLAVLFRGGWRVGPVTKAGESLDDAQRRVVNLIKNDSGSVLLLQMLHPERAPLVWKNISKKE